MDDCRQAAVMCGRCVPQLSHPEEATIEAKPAGGNDGARPPWLETVCQQNRAGTNVGDQTSRVVGQSVGNIPPRSHRQGLHRDPSACWMRCIVMWLRT